MSVIEANDGFQRLPCHFSVPAFESDQGGKVMRPGHIGLLGKRCTTQIRGALPIARAERRESFFNDLLHLPGWPVLAVFAHRRP
jgi:hypothetical protein